MFKNKFWQKHANPWSGWTRIAIYPFLFLSIWYHNWYGLALLILWTIINPLVFPKPKKIRYWVSKVVLGEQLYMKKGYFQKNFILVLTLLGTISFFYALYATYINSFWPALYTATLAFVFKLWISDRMVFYYEMRRK